MQVSEIMSKDVISITPQTPVAHAAKLMLDHHISGLPVVDDAGTLVGIVTEGDFLRRAETGNVRKRSRWLEFLVGPGRLADEYVHTHGRKVEEVMTREVVTVGEQDSLDEVVTLMEKHGIKRVPVLRDRQLVGIVSRANLMRALLVLTRTPATPLPSDRAIHQRIRTAVEQEPWGRRARSTSSYATAPWSFTDRYSMSASGLRCTCSSRTFRRQGHTGRTRLDRARLRNGCQCLRME